MSVVLNKAGLSKTFPSVLLFAPQKYHGLSLQNPWVDQYLTQIRRLMYETSNDTITGSLFCQLIEQTKLEIGLEGSLHLMPWDSIQQYLSSSWIRSLFQFAHEHDITIYEKTPCLLPRRKNDGTIIALALQMDLAEKELQRVNNVRQWL